MQIIFNQNKLELENKLNIVELLEKQGFKESCFAVMINNKFVPKNKYDITFLKKNDNVVTLQPMQGG